MTAIVALTLDSTIYRAGQLAKTCVSASEDTGDRMQTNVNIKKVPPDELYDVPDPDLAEGRDGLLRKPLMILMVDDDDGDRAQLKRVLKQTGLPCMCTETSSINDALGACEQSTFDCAVVDYR